MIRFRVKKRHIAGAIVALPFLAVFGAWVGVFNVGAASGHWKITDWFLHFAMQSSVRTYALPIEAPDPLPREGLQAAAGHFERGCAVCHGSPASKRSAAVRQMLPEPPDLSSVLATDKWTDEELFRVVKKGVRFTGMPAWPTQDRDDEVWAMVAFLRELPELDARQYRALAFGPSADASAGVGVGSLESVIAGCARCHGENGEGRGELVPVLAGQHEAYLQASLEAYAEERRESGIMQQAALDTDPDMFADLAAYYASLPPVNTQEQPASAEQLARGEEIARSGIPKDEVPACNSCHARPDRNPLYPSLDGQKAFYIKNQLELFAQDKRGGTPLSELMHSFAGYLEEADMNALAAYFSSLEPPPPRRAGLEPAD